MAEEGQEPQESISLDWETAPKDFREEYKANVEKLKAQEEALSQAQQKVVAYERQQAFEKALAEAGEGVEGITLDDLGDLPADSITPTLLKAKAAELNEGKQAQLEEQAKAHGFESAEDFQKALEAAKALKKEQWDQLSKANQVMAQGGLETAPPPEEKSDAQIVSEAYETAQKAGAPQDAATAAAFRDLMTTKNPAKEGAEAPPST